MNEGLGGSLVLLVSGILLLIFEIFIPSHGVLTIASLGCLGFGIWMAFGVSAGFGYVASIATVVLVPTIAIIAIRVWHRTPLGKRISPPNPVLTAADRVGLSEDIDALVGKTGRSRTLLRPVGTCEFDGHRIECVAEMGVIEAGQPVRAVRVEGRDLIVTVDDTQSESA